MGCYVEDVIKIARAEVGYLEKKTNSQLDSKTANAGSNNYTKYARDMDNIPNFYNGKKNGFAWCDVFVDWCFNKAFGTANAKRLLCQPDKSYGAGCQASMNYYKQKNQLYTSPKIGIWGVCFWRWEWSVPEPERGVSTEWFRWCDRCGRGFSDFCHILTLCFSWLGGCCTGGSIFCFFKYISYLCAVFLKTIKIKHKNHDYSFQSRHSVRQKSVVQGRELEVYER